MTQKISNRSQKPNASAAMTMSLHTLHVTQITSHVLIAWNVPLAFNAARQFMKTF
jgi:hypothetical protein